MYLRLKKSKITHWWVAKPKSKMAFINILSRENLNEDLLVVGYLDIDKRELATSSNRVVKVNKKGVITEKGSFYPFEQAHQLYLQFLIEANKENTLIATDWDYASKISKHKIIADIVRKDGIEKGVTFDFTPIEKGNVMLNGYSKDLSSYIVLTTFTKRNVCITFKIPDSVKSDIYSSSFALEEETMKKSEQYRIFLLKNSNNFILANKEIQNINFVVLNLFIF